MLLEKSFATLAAAFLISTGQGNETNTPSVDTETYIALSPSVRVAACTRDGFMHSYSGPVAISQTDIRKHGKTVDDINLDSYANRLQKIFADSVAKLDRAQLYKADGLITVDKALRHFAKTIESETGISNGFVVTSVQSTEAPSPECGR